MMQPEKIVLQCPACGATGRAPAAMSGKKIACPACGQRVTMASPACEAEEDPPRKKKPPVLRAPGDIYLCSDGCAWGCGIAILILFLLLLYNLDLENIKTRVEQNGSLMYLINAAEGAKLAWEGMMLDDKNPTAEKTALDLVDVVRRERAEQKNRKEKIEEKSTEYMFSIAEVKYKLVDEQSCYCVMSWKCEIENMDSKPHPFFITARFVDEDKMQLEDANEIAVVQARSKSTITGTIPIKTDIYDRLKDLAVEVRRHK